MIKKMILAFLVVSLCLIGNTFAEHEIQKFKAVFTITYNEVTLEQAAKIEKILKKINAKACKVETEIVEDNNDGDILFYHGGSVLLDDNFTLENDSLTINLGSDDQIIWDNTVPDDIGFAVPYVTKKGL